MVWNVKLVQESQPSSHAKPLTPQTSCIDSRHCKTVHQRQLESHDHTREFLWLEKTSEDGTSAQTWLALRSTQRSVSTHRNRGRNPSLVDLSLVLTKLGTPTIYTRAERQPYTRHRRLVDVPTAGASANLVGSRRKERRLGAVHLRSYLLHGNIRNRFTKDTNSRRVTCESIVRVHKSVGLDYTQRDSTRGRHCCVWVRAPLHRTAICDNRMSRSRHVKLHESSAESFLLRGKFRIVRATPHHTALQRDRPTAASRPARACKCSAQNMLV